MIRISQFEWYRECIYTRLKAIALGRFFYFQKQDILGGQGEWTQQSIM